MIKSQESSNTKPPISIGTQINIQNLNIDLTQTSTEEDQCRVEKSPQSEAEGLFLGTSALDYEKLSNIVQNFYGTADKKIEAKKRKNSPMLIKFFE